MNKLLNVRINEETAEEFKKICEEMGKTQTEVLMNVIYQTIYDHETYMNCYSIEYMRTNKEAFHVFIQILKDADDKKLFKGVYKNIDQFLYDLKGYEKDFSCLAISCGGDSYTEYFDADCMDEETDSDIDAIQTLDLGNKELRIHMRFRPFEEDTLTEWNALEIK